MNIKSKKCDLLYLISGILIYAIISILAELLSNKIGIKNSINALAYILLVVFTLLFLSKHNKMLYYGLESIDKLDCKNLLYFIPLIMIALVNLLKGISINVSIDQFILISICMTCVAFFEEILFRAFLMRTLMNKSDAFALIISSSLFGIIHLLNIFNTNSNIYEVIIQSIYALSSGFLYSSFFYKTKNIVPIILGHALLNFLNIFLPLNLTLKEQIIGCLVISIISIAYAIYILKTKKQLRRVIR